MKTKKQRNVNVLYSLKQRHTGGFYRVYMQQLYDKMRPGDSVDRHERKEETVISLLG